MSFPRYFISFSIRLRRFLISFSISSNFFINSLLGSGLSTFNTASKKVAKNPAITWPPGTNCLIAPNPASIVLFAIRIFAASSVITKGINRNINISLIFLYIIFFDFYFF